MLTIREKTDLILKGLDIRKVLSEESIEGPVEEPSDSFSGSSEADFDASGVNPLEDLYNILNKATETLLSYGIKARLEKEGNGLIWAVNVPNSVQNVRVLKVLEVLPNGLMRCDPTMKFAAPGVMNLNKLNNVQGLVNAVEKFMVDMKKEFGKNTKVEEPEEKDKEEPEEEQEQDIRPAAEKIQELPFSIRSYAKKGLKAATKLQNILKSSPSVTGNLSGNTKEYRVTSDKILAGSDNNLYINLNIDGVNLESLNTDDAKSFRSSVVDDLEEKGITSDFVIDKKNKVRFLGLVGTFPRFKPEDRLKIMKAYDGTVEFK